MKKLLYFGSLTLLLASCSQEPVEKQYEGFTLIQQDGPTLGYSTSSGIKILRNGNKAFKDLNHNEVLDKYEDWRLPLEERIADLVSQLSKEEIAGLMLYSNHQAVPTPELSEAQQKFLAEDNLRHVLVTTVGSPEIAAQWNNNVQAFVEGLGHGIPANNSSDPRHGARSDSEFNAGAGGQISMWPNELGMGATFDPELMREFGHIAAQEYRALGFATALSPQIDIATDPRWMRFSGTYGEDPNLVTSMAEAYCDGFQTSTGSDALYGAWGLKSVNAMAKHWPGGGPCEAGRDAHYGRGQFAVYPNNNMKLQKQSFLDGAFKLKNGTSMAAAVMPYYTISYGQSNENVANNFNADIIGKQLREEAGFDGVVCTDWGVTADEVHPGIHSGKPYGVESLTVAERHMKVLMAGVDQFGGNNDKMPVLEAFELMAKEMGEEQMMERIKLSASRLLRNIFRTGLFENPYLIPAETQQLVGNADFMQKGYEAQVKSIVMIKNYAQTLPLKATEKKTKVYIPQRYYPAHNSFWGPMIPADTITPVPAEIGNKYFELTETPEEAEAALVFIDSPFSGWGYRLTEALKNTKLEKELPAALLGLDNYFIPKGGKIAVPGNGYYPISLQYEDYIATTAREHSIAQGTPFDGDRSYKGKGVKTFNYPDLKLVQEMRAKMGDKKVIVVINSTNPTVLTEIEPLADAILVTFEIQKQAILEIVNGTYEPSGLLPFQMPADMETVEAQAEDTPRDMKCYTDADGHVYDFAYGLNWSGVINDARVARFK